MKKKFRIFFLVIFIISFLCVACGINEPRDNLRIRWKTNTLEAAGDAAASYKERIYYVSNELGVPGLYSMKEDGTDLWKEIRNHSVTSLQIQEDKLYFVGLEYWESEGNSTLQGYSRSKHMLYEKPIEGSPRREQKVYYIHSYENLMNFYISPKHYAVLTYGSGSANYFEQIDVQYLDHLIPPTADEFQMREIIDDYRYSSKGTEITTMQFTCIDEKPHPEDPSLPKQEKRIPEIEITVSEFGDLYTVNGFEKNSYRGGISIFDKNTGNVVRLDSDPGSFDGLVRSFLMDEQNIYCAYCDQYFSDKEQIIIIDRNKWQVKDQFILKDIAETHRISQKDCMGQPVCGIRSIRLRAMQNWKIS